MEETISKKDIEYEINSRHIRETYYFLNKAYPVSTLQASKDMGISQRTLKKDLNKVYELLGSVGVELIRVPRIGVYIKNLTKEQRSGANANKRLTKLLEFYSKNIINYEKSERFKKILFNFLSLDKIATIEDLSFELNVSRTTVIKDIKAVRSWLAKANIHVKSRPGVGYSIYGDEKDFRNTLASVLSSELASFEVREESKLTAILSSTSFLTKYLILHKYLIDIEDLNFSTVSQCIEHLELLSGSELLEEDFFKLAILIIISVVRFKKEHCVMMKAEALSKVKNYPEYNYVRESLLFFNVFKNNVIPPEEIAYITLQYANSEFLRRAETLQKKREKNLGEEIFKSCEDLIGIPLSSEVDIMQMCSMHIASTIKRLENNVKIENPFTNEIKLTYPFCFNIISYLNNSVVRKNLKLLFPETEIAFLTSYIVASIERIRNNGDKYPKRTIAVICSLNPGLFNLVLYKLKSEFPNVDILPVFSSTELFESKAYSSLSAIISTTSLSGYRGKVPLIEVKELLSAREVERIKGILKMGEESDLSNSLFDISRDIVFNKTDFKNQDEAIHFLLKTLEEKKFIDEKYSESIVLQSKLGFITYFQEPSTPIALLRPVEFVPALKNGIGIVVFNSPVIFSSLLGKNHTTRVKIAVMPVFKNKARENIKYYDHFVKFLQEQYNWRTTQFSTW